MPVHAPIHFEGATILSVGRPGRVVMGGDGQVSFGNTVMKGNACKSGACAAIRSWPASRAVTVDAFTLFERFEAKLDKHQGNLKRSAVELAKDGRTDRAVRCQPKAAC